MRALLLLALLAGAAAAQQLPSRAVSHLRGAAQQLARKGRAGEMREVLTILRDGGMDAKRLAKLEKSCAASLKRARRDEDPQPAIAKALRKAADEIEAGLALTDAPLARLLLRLDDTRSKAHKALGHLEHAGGWATPAERKLQKRREAIEAAWKTASALEVRLETGTSDVDAMRKVHGRSGGRVAWTSVHLHSGEIPPVVLARILTDALRASALSNWIRTGEAEIPDVDTRVHLVLTGTDDAYRRWAEAAPPENAPQPDDLWFVDPTARMVRSVTGRTTT